MESIKAISSLNDLKPFKSAWRVHVKVLHTWTTSSLDKESSLEMILTDENVSYNIYPSVFLTMFYYGDSILIFVKSSFRVSRSKPVANNRCWNDSRCFVVLENGNLFLTLTYDQYLEFTDTPTMFTKWFS